MGQIIWKVIIVVLFRLAPSLALIIYAQELGGYIGFAGRSLSYIDTKSPAWLVRLFGCLWFAAPAGFCVPTLFSAALAILAVVALSAIAYYVANGLLPL